MRITYDEAFKDRIIDKLGLKVGQGGYLIEKKTNRPITDINGDYLKYDQFKGIAKGSVHYIRDDLPSLIKLSKLLRSQRD